MTVIAVLATKKVTKTKKINKLNVIGINILYCSPPKIPQP